jgi:thioredoxin 1
MQLVHFTATWCQPCKTMLPVIEEFINENQELDYIKIDIDNDKEMYEEYTKDHAVMSVPTFFAVQDGKVVKTQVGATTKDVLASLFV